MISLFVRITSPEGVVNETTFRPENVSPVGIDDEIGLFLEKIQENGNPLKARVYSGLSFELDRIEDLPGFRHDRKALWEYMARRTVISLNGYIINPAIDIGTC